ncbi:hypothetical protein LTS12_028543, partial [Elasticomyces elasticus]
MNVQQAEWAIPGTVPDSLAAVLAGDEANRPVKRRKANTGPQNLRQLNGASEAGVPNGYIPLARVSFLL